MLPTAIHFQARHSLQQHTTTDSDEEQAFFIHLQVPTQHKKRLMTATTITNQVMADVQMYVKLSYMYFPTIHAEWKMLKHQMQSDRFLATV